MSLKQPITSEGLGRDTIGTIDTVYSDASVYEVEFVDGGGATAALLMLKEDEIQRVSRSSLE